MEESRIIFAWAGKSATSSISESSISLAAVISKVEGKHLLCRTWITCIVIGLLYRWLDGGYIMTTQKTDIKQGSPERFGHSWKIFNEILPIHEEQFKRWSEGVSRNDWKDKHILDVGCGIGRNCYWAMRYGAKSALCIDVDERTLLAAEKNLSNYPAAKIQYKSIYELDLIDEFDICFSIGVIHHLENPQLALKKILDATKPGGRAFIWIYGYENNEWVVKYFNPLRKFLFSRLPLPLVYALSLPLTTLLWMILRLGLGKIEYFKLLRQFSFRHIRAIVYDQMLPKIAHYYTKQQAKNLLNDAGFKDVEIHWVNQMSWAVIGDKPNN